jgi:hypothetical protein
VLSTGPWDAILIPGGGVRAAGALPPWIEARFDLALEHRRTDEWMLPLSAGTPHRPPPLDDAGFPILEAVAGARYLLARGVPSARILIEGASYDTIGNAYFARVIHCAPRGLARLLVVTSQFHMARTEAVFRWIFSLPGPGRATVLDFAAAPDTGIPAEHITLRRDKEMRGVENVAVLAARLRTLPALHGWMFTEHAAYAASDARPAPAAPPELY